MPYGIIVIVAVIAVVVNFVVRTDASVVAKGVVVALLGLSLACFFWLHRYTLTALFVMVGLGIFISLHRICVKAGSSDR